MTARTVLLNALLESKAMQPNVCKQRGILGVLVISLIFGLTACFSNVVYHSFSFDVSRDNQDAEVIDFQYGNSKLPVHASEQALRDRQTYQAYGVTGPMLRGEFLYVKWRIKSTGKIYEDKVDLRQRLPKNITDHEVYFLVRGAQLYVYLISPEKRPPDIPPNGPSAYHARLVTTIYPDSAISNSPLHAAPQAGP